MSTTEIDELQKQCDNWRRMAADARNSGTEKHMRLTEAQAEILRLQTVLADGASFQDRVGKWMMSCFGADITNSLQERCYRFFEEAGELCQALGMTEQEARDMVAYTWGREKGEPDQEVGGVMVTFAAACNAAGLSMVEGGERELTRISSPEIMEKIRRKHAAKVLRTPHSALPGIPDA